MAQLSNVGEQSTNTWLAYSNRTCPRNPDPIVGGGYDYELGDNIITLDEVDAGDILTIAYAIQSTGDGWAFDVSVVAELPDDFSPLTPPCMSWAHNGSLVSYTGDFYSGDGVRLHTSIPPRAFGYAGRGMGCACVRVSACTDALLFYCFILRLCHPNLTYTPPPSPLSPFFFTAPPMVRQTFSILVTYEVFANQTVQSGRYYTFRTALTSFSAYVGSVNYLQFNRRESSTLLIKAPTIAATLSYNDTSLPATTNAVLNPVYTDLAPGEEFSFFVTVTAAESTSPTFVRIYRADAPGLTLTNAAVVSVGGNLPLGNITVAFPDVFIGPSAGLVNLYDNVDDGNDTLVIRYDGYVNAVNASDSQVQSISARVFWSGTDGTPTASAPVVYADIVEPDLTVTVACDVVATDAGNVSSCVLSVFHTPVTSKASAYDLVRFVVVVVGGVVHR